MTDTKPSLSQDGLFYFQVLIVSQLFNAHMLLDAF